MTQRFPADVTNTNQAHMHTLYAVFGKPVLHSKSPQMFSSIFGQQDRVCYTRILPRSPADIIHIVKLLNIRGASITAPFKESVLPYVDEVTPAVDAIGAVNCLHYSDGLVKGHNTDHIGVTGALKESGIVLRDAKILVLGAGGAARAAVYGLVSEGARVSISNRTMSKAEELAGRFGCTVVPWTNNVRIPRFDAVVSTLLPEAIPPFISKAKYDVLFDAIYKPSRMSDYTKRQSITVIGGEQWLIHQGIEAAAFYTGIRPSPETMAGKINTVPDRDKLQICVLRKNNAALCAQQCHDLVVSAFDLDQHTINQLINEEKSLAFGH